jgi:hypothetical protein
MSEEIAEPISLEARAVRLETYADRVRTLADEMGRDNNIPDGVVGALVFQSSRLRDLARVVRSGSRRRVGR